MLVVKGAVDDDDADVELAVAELVVEPTVVVDVLEALVDVETIAEVVEDTAEEDKLEDEELEDEELEDEELEDGELDVASDKTPPTAPPEGEVDAVADLARIENAARVSLPVAGLWDRWLVLALEGIKEGHEITYALIAATMPDWQWLPAVCPQ